MLNISFNFCIRLKKKERKEIYKKYMISLIVNTLRRIFIIIIILAHQSKPI